MSQELKRYTFESAKPGVVTAREWVHGPWVAHSDVAHLLRSHEALREALQAWMEWNEQTSWSSDDETEQDRRELMFNSRAALTEAAAQKENGNG